YSYSQKPSCDHHHPYAYTLQPKYQSTFSTHSIHPAQYYANTAHPIPGSIAPVSDDSPALYSTPSSPRYPYSPINSPDRSLHTPSQAHWPVQAQSPRYSQASARSIPETGSHALALATSHQNHHYNARTSQRNPHYPSQT